MEVSGQGTNGWRYKIYKNLVGKPEGRTPLGVWSVDWRIIFYWTYKEVDWIHLA
jgi:hypothetical protein